MATWDIGRGAEEVERRGKRREEMTRGLDDAVPSIHSSETPTNTTTCCQKQLQAFPGQLSWHRKDSLTLKEPPNWKPGLRALPGCAAVATSSLTVKRKGTRSPPGSWTVVAA